MININNNTINCSNNWNFNSINEDILIEQFNVIIEAINQQGNTQVYLLDIANVTRVDSCGIYFINKLQNLLIIKQIKFTTKFTDHQQQLFNLIIQDVNTNQTDRQKHEPNQQNIKNNKNINVNTFIKQLFFNLFSSFNFFIFLGQCWCGLIQIIKHPTKIVFSEIINTIYQDGFCGILVIILLNFLIGLTLAYEMSSQFIKYGANVYIVNFLGIAVLKEVAPLLSAIIIAGRTGSAITASIGTMKIQEEIDALKAMGISPIIHLVLPKMLAIIIICPLLITVADMTGIIGGMLVANYKLALSYNFFLERMQDVVPLSNYLYGLIKSVAFGTSIALIGAFYGLSVFGNADSIGKYTTKSVVISIITIVIIDALFAVVNIGLTSVN